MQRDNAAYVYTDEYHRPLLMKIRREGWVSRKDKYLWRAADYRNARLSWKGGTGCVERYQPEWADQAMYNLPALKEALRTGAPIYFPEGERDCDTGTSLFGWATTTNWQGARAFTIGQAHWFTLYKARSRINLLIDNDDAGHFAANLRRRRMKAVGVDPKRIRLLRPIDPAHSDLTDVALAGLGLDAYERVGHREVRERAAQYDADLQASGLSPHAFYQSIGRSLRCSS